jgi:hypothetical protein
LELLEAMEAEGVVDAGEEGYRKRKEIVRTKQEGLL